MLLQLASNGDEICVSGCYTFWQTSCATRKQDEGGILGRINYGWLKRSGITHINQLAVGYRGRITWLPISKQNKAIVSQVIVRRVDFTYL